MRSILHTIVVLLLCVVPAQAAQHPAWGYPPNPLPEGYGTAGLGFPAAFNYGDIMFYAPYPDPASLTDSEKYIIAGTQSSSKGGGLYPWHRAIIQLVDSIYINTGQIPSALTPEVFSTVMDVDEATRIGAIDQFRSPITGEFPRLDAVDFAPGQVYVRLLTEEEKRHFADTYDVYQDNWFEGISRHPVTGEPMPIQMPGGVYYFRFYGEHDVLYAGIDYFFAEAN